MASKETIKVACRIRPMNKEELQKRADPVVEVCDKTVTVKEPAKGNEKEKKASFTFDWAFGARTTQIDFYDAVAKPMVTYVLEGYNATIFAYGQTSSGKTHTMEGASDSSEDQGVIPRIVKHIFSSAEEISGSQFILEVSYLELYCEEINDLLGDNSAKDLPLKMLKKGERGSYVAGLESVCCSTLADVLDLLDEGKHKRHVSATKMNNRSSRSHALFQLKLSRTDKETNVKTTSKLTLVDLAGSEKVSKTEITDKEQITEMKKINLSLTQLGLVINNLSENQKHINYRDSKLTRLLEDSLGGNSRTVIIICCSPALYNVSETRSTMQFGERAKKIKNVTKKNIEKPPEEWKRLYEEQLRNNEVLIKELKKWRAGISVASPDQAEYTKSITTEGGEAAELPSSSSAVSPEQQKLAETETLEREIDEKDAELIEAKNKSEVLLKENSELIIKLNDITENLDRITKEYEQFKEEFESNKQEKDEVLQALSELGDQVDQMNGALDEKDLQLDSMEQQVQEMQDRLDSVKVSTSTTKEAVDLQKKKYAVILRDIHREALIVEELLVGKASDLDCADDSFEQLAAATRVYMGKLSTDAQSLIDEKNKLEKATKEAKATETELLAKVLQRDTEVTELKSKIDATQSGLDEDHKVRVDLQQQLDTQTSDFRKLKTENDALNTRLSNPSCNLAEMKKHMDGKFNNYASQYDTQLKELRKKLQDKDADITKHKDLNIAAKAQLDSTRAENSALRVEIDKSKHEVEKLKTQEDAREKSRTTLKGFEDAITKQMQTMNHLRKMFVQDLQARIKKVTSATIDSGDLSEGLSAIHQERIKFLQSSLDETNKAQKDIIKRDTELLCETSKLEKRLKSSQERCKMLENGVREVKELRMRDQKKFAAEMERLKEPLTRSGGRRGARSNIVAPIKPKRPTTGADD